ncbi:type VI secretion system-associated FHA domain protein TagH [Nitrosospira sp. Nsp13]|uniref:type VI secretion system-associated FHA domain protein TagH n=1 Tax=Nitrosospira sp. Nsp13 TaxID=1855332 RepID=UPI000884589E|nr:type VI secretion system-associated FHA domain protein TagH [Nitrosospira sp. Nsp13]SCX78041.1 FHA domain protein [Nitrosospira sp. Nsp13]
MIRIQVTSYNGTSLSQPLFAEFNEMGGNIGRAEGNALVLHDPTRTISRTHASIAFRGGGYVIRNLGTAMPVYVNDRSLGNGQDTAIAAGDEIRIGGYIMQVAGREKPALIRDGEGIGPSNLSKDDPLELFGGPPGPNPFDDLIKPPAGHPGPQSQVNPLSKAKGPFGNLGADGLAPVSSAIIPPDFDPSVEVPSLKSQSRPFFTQPHSPQPEDIFDGLGPLVPNKSIDELWDLGPETSSDPLAPGAPLASPLSQSNMASLDPLVVLNAVSEKKSSGSHVQRDDGPELENSYHPPKAKPDPAIRAVSPAAPQTGSVSSSEPGSLVLSWGSKESQDTGEIISVIVPSPAHERRRSDRRRSEQQSAVQGEVVFDKVAPAGESATMPVDLTPEPKSIADRDELLHAFLAGAGVPDLVIPAGLTPQFMNTLGQLLRESTQGTLDLLLARTLTKREVRADLTMIAPRENNPLKFSPGVEVALLHLLAPQGRGFMTPLQAMKDAHDDLRSHQFGFMAGMRAALAGVLERFDPVELEQRLTQKTVIDSLIPINRKAKLWDLFADRYKDISHEAEEDFHVLFGKEFLRAYEAQIAKLERDDKNMKR